jgi:hypothetical protein
MTIRYTNTFSEVLGFHFSAVMRSRVVWGAVAVTIGLDAQEIWSSLSEEESEPVEPWVSVVAGTAGLAAMFAVIFVSLALFAIVVAWRDKRSLAEHAITLTDRSLITETPFSRTEWWWRGVVRLKRVGSNLFLYAAPSEVEALIIPRRAFAGDAEWDAFQSFCAERIGRA